MINENTEREKRRFELIGERYDKLDEQIQHVNTLIDTVRNTRTVWKPKVGETYAVHVNSIDQTL